MLFSSLDFLLIFLPLVLLGFHLLRRTPWVLHWLIAASLFFYGWWYPPYLSLLVGSILFNYGWYVLLVRLVNSGHQRINGKLALAIGIGANLICLGYYKYSHWGSLVLEQAGFPITAMPEIILPLAISFFTFQQIAFLVDGYKQKLAPPRFSQYCLFVCFFPQLIAGPIVHHQQLIPQLKRLPGPTTADIQLGCWLLAAGLVKKLLLADTLGETADAGYTAILSLNAWSAWLTTLSYSLQLYFDFSGYCDMAMGLALFFGIRIPLNFDSPYRARNLQIFWRTWHITLGDFLRRYVYLPLGGRRQWVPATLFNLLVTFVLGGIWHGAGWQFLIWGLWHGLGVGLVFLMHRMSLQLPLWLAWVCTLIFVHLGWVWFRAEDVPQAIQMFNQLAIWEHSSQMPDVRAWTLVLFAGFIALWLPNSFRLGTALISQGKSYLLWGSLVGLGMGLLQLLNDWALSLTQQKFLYFDF